MDKSPFRIERTVKAPRDTVWAAWTETERLAHWWGPKGCTVRVQHLDLRAGGRFHYVMDWPAGGAMWGLFQYREVKPTTRLEYFNSFSNEAGEVTRAPFAGKWPLLMLTTVSFESVSAGSEASAGGAAGGEATTIRIEWAPYEADDEEWRTFDEGRASMTQGWGGTLEQLEAYLAGQR